MPGTTKNILRGFTGGLQVMTKNVSIEDLSKEIHVTKRTIGKLVRYYKMPQNEDGDFPLEKCKKWYKKYAITRGIFPGNPQLLNDHKFCFHQLNVQ